MAMAKDLFNRYVWLVDTIYRLGKITFEEINVRWLRTQMSEDKEIPLRTFHNHRKAIEDLFDINIECDKAGGYKYYIENIDDIERGGVRSWLLNTFAVNNLINESHKLKSRILFEHIPSGQIFLVPIIEAMRDSKTIEITYQSYWRDKSNTFELQPYCVKVFRQRWYVLAKSIYYDKIMIYALDRVSNVVITESNFIIPKAFDPAGYFFNCFGIINEENIEPEVVKVKVLNREHKDRYFHALPLHHSQQEVEITADYSVFSYYIKPTYDFRQELLSHGSEVEVLTPEWFRDSYISAK